MSLPGELMALGLPHSLAERIGADIVTGVVAAGTSQTTAATVAGAFIEVATAAASSGIILMGGPDNFTIFNGGASPLSVYPPVGGYMNGTQNAAFSVTNAKSAFFFRAGNRYIGVLSA
jgi:hypothetical protein